ncbi:MAG: F0F1 ATP synthase subunit epsilon [Flavobacteriales bacterium]|nr:F0F1 ATP synthase subunit epsilon [Flavobacteriales bacterium]
MYLEIISPEKVLFKGEVNSVSVPGANGEFQMLNNHAAILSTLVKGVITFEVENTNANFEAKGDDISTNGNLFSLEIKGGVLEMNDNKAIILPS